MKAKYTKTFPGRLYVARKLAKITQTELARQLGVRPQTVQKWEAGTVTPGIARLEQAAGILKVKPGWLAFGKSA